MKEIQEIVNNKVESLVNDGVIAGLIEDSVQKAITKALETQFESWGTITKQIDKALEDALKIDMSQLPIETYNEQMAVAVKSRLNEFFKGAASNKFMESIDKVLEPAPKEMDINDFIETIVGHWKTDEPGDADDLDDYATVEFEDKERGSMKCCTLKMWKQKEYKPYLSGSVRENSPDLQLYIIDGEIRISHRQSYNPTCFSEHECFVFKLYSAGTELTGIDGFDPDDCDLTLKDEQY